jgi:hypothetical protein
MNGRPNRRYFPICFAETVTFFDDLRSQLNFLFGFPFTVASALLMALLFLLTVEM